MSKACCRVMTIVLLCSSLTACTTRLTYNFLDWWLEWQIRDYVSLDEPQKQSLRGTLDQFHLWHREQELQHYLAFGQKLVRRLDQGPLTLEDMEVLNRELAQFWDTILAQLLPEAVNLASTLSDSQVTQLLAEVQKKNLKFFKKYVDHPEEKILRNRQRLLSKNLKPFLGKLNSAQEARLQQWQREYSNSLPLAYAERLRWHAMLEGTLATRHKLELSRKKMAALLTYSVELWDPEYRTMARANRQATLNMLVDINNLANAKQIKQRRRHIEKYLQDFSSLVAQN